MAIEPKPLVATEPVNIRVPQDVLEQLDAYCKFLGGATDRTYVIVETLRQVIARDKRYRKARTNRPAASSASTPSASPRSGS
jgi:hypothetical protein